MYNYQTFLREKHIDKKCQSIRKEYLKDQNKRQKSTPSLAHAHKKRVEGFILSAIDKPIPVSQYHNQPPCFRHTSSDKNIGAKGFYLRRQNQSQRIQSSLHKNSDLDHVPFNNTTNHKFRQFHGKGLKYQAMTQSLRVKDYLDKQDLNYLPNSTPKQDKLLKKALAAQKLQLSTLNKSLHKTLLPVLHSKTYFKSVSTLFTQIPSQVYRVQNSGVTNQGNEEIEGERRSTKPKDHLSRKQNSRQALIKCNMLPSHFRA